MNSIGRRDARYLRRKEKRDAKKRRRLSPFDDFSRIADPDSLYAAFRKCRKGVAWKESVQRYEMNLLRNINDTHKKLVSGESVCMGFAEFALWERGRLRNIRSVHISERVVHKCVCDLCLTPLLSNGLVYDNGASLKGKGLHFAVRRLVRHLSLFYRENGRSNEGYCLSIDFSKFFDSIRHDVLLAEAEGIIRDERIMKLFRDFIFSFGDGVSLGLGSQVSQISALFYSNKVDHTVKEKQRIRYFGRYMDDMYLVHRSREYLVRCLSEIEAVCGTLGITVNRKKTKIVKLSGGIKFLKGIYTLADTGRVVRRADPESRKRMRRKLRKFKTLLEAGKMGYRDVYDAYQSWRGNYLKRFDAYHTVRRMDALYNELFILPDRRVS